MGRGHHAGGVLAFLSSLGTGLLKLVPGNDARNAGLVCLNIYRKDPQAHGYTVVAFHPKVFRVSLFIFSQGMARLCKDVY